MRNLKGSFSYPFRVLVFFILVFSIFFCGCVGDSTTVSTDGNKVSEQNLRLHLIVDSDANSVFSSDETNDNFTEGLAYVRVKDVTIDIDGKSMKLEKALQDGTVSAAEIFCFARLDAEAGICHESSESTYGLTNFTYSYPDYDLRIIYDVYETPDGQQHLISELGIYPPGTQPTARKVFSDNENIIRYDQEDWGLSFEVAEVSSTSITINLNQTGGQQIGQLYVKGYYLGTEAHALTRLDGTNESPSMDFPIIMDGSTQLVIDWTDTFGALPSGCYYLDLNICDVYDESQVHPLMVNYYDSWCYQIEFEIT